MKATIKVMLVEDSFSAGQMLQTYLNRENLEVHVVDSPQEALAHLQSSPDAPDLIMGEVNTSYELCCFVRQHHRFRHIPIILFTPDCLSQKLTCFEAGANDYMVQPVQPRELLVRIKVLLALVSRPGYAAKLSRIEPGNTAFTTAKTNLMAVSQ